MSTTTSATATLLQSLKVTAAKKAIGNNPQAHRRMKLARKLWEQIQLAKSQAEGTNFTMTRFRSVTDPDGSRRSVEVPRRVRAWWWTTEANKLALNIRYGARKIEISKGKSAVEIATAADLVPTLELIKQAVEAGAELAKLSNPSSNPALPPNLVILKLTPCNDLRGLGKHGFDFYHFNGVSRQLWLDHPADKKVLLFFHGRHRCPFA